MNCVRKIRINNIAARIVSDNGLAPTRQQAIIWTNDGWYTGAYLRHSTSMGEALWIYGI